MVATDQEPDGRVLDRHVGQTGPVLATAVPIGADAHNIPRPLTSFVGREREIADVQRILDCAPLLTLTGTGGVGKTRLGHEVAASLLDRYEDGVWLVELATVIDPVQVPRAVADVLGVREGPQQPTTAALVTALRLKHLLLVLDNCELTAAACAELADVLLRACPGIRILATSRQPLGMAGETTFRVPSLGLPPLRDDLLPLEPSEGAALEVGTDTRRHAEMSGVVAQSEAVHLFVERARAVVPTFALTGRTIEAVETICRRLDGIPLAIELAAVRIEVLCPGQIAARLDDRFRLLSSGSATALPRYRTLRAMIDWSHDLLNERERLLFRRLAVFAGGWTLEAAERVCAGDGLDSEDVLDLLSGLVTKSMVATVKDAEESRYRFLESIRVYAEERLQDSAEADLLAERHRDWALALAELAEPELVGPNQAAWLHRLDRERDNLLAAQRWAIAQDDETILRFGAALWRFWYERADAAEAHWTIDGIGSSARRAEPSLVVARALHGAAALAGMLSEYETCRTLLGDGLAIARQLDDHGILATLLDSLGRQAFIVRRHSEARPLLNEAVTLFRALDDRPGLTRALSHLGFLEYLEGRQTEARATYQEGLRLARQDGDLGEVAELLDNLGRTSQAAGDLEAAVGAYQEAQSIWRKADQGNWLAMALNNLGGVEALRGELVAARAHLREALVLSRRTGNRRRQAFTLAAAAILAAVEGQPRHAVRLHGAATVAMAELGASLEQPAYAPFVPHLNWARHTIGSSEDSRASDEGRALPLAQAVEECLAWLAEPSQGRRTGLQDHASEPDAPKDVTPILSMAPPSTGPVSLSPREREVATLVAQGRTNRQIAQELVITEGTAASHVKHILARLTLDSRVQIATWAIEHGLHRAPTMAWSTAS